MFLGGFNMAKVVTCLLENKGEILILRRSEEDFDLTGEGSDNICIRLKIYTLIRTDLQTTKGK